MSDDNTEFDLDAGVADIAADMGFTSDDDDYTEDETESSGSELGSESEKDEKVDKENEKVDKDDEQEEESSKPLDTKPAPASWSKEQHENWAKVPKEAQDYIELREKQMLDGIEQYKDGYRYGEQLDRALAPYREDIRANGISETTAIQNLFEHHRALTKGSIEQRQQAFVVLGQSIGVIPQEGQQLPDPHTQQLQARLDAIERAEQARQQQAQQQSYATTAKQVEEFASHPDNIYFEEVADLIIPLLKTGIDLKTAYEQAVWANPITRAKEMAKTTALVNEQAAKKQKEEALRAKKAIGSNVRSASTTRSSALPMGSMDDTMMEALAAIKARA